VAGILDYSKEELDNIFNWSPGEFVEGYPGKVREQARLGFETISRSPVFAGSQGGGQVALSVVTPLLDKFKEQFESLIASSIDKGILGYGFPGGGSFGKRFEGSGEQLAAPIALAGSLMKGRWTSQAIKTILERMSKRRRATPKQWEQEIIEGGGGRELKEIDVVFPGSNAVDMYGNASRYSSNLEDFFKDDKNSIPAGEVLKKLYDRKMPLQETILRGENLKYWHTIKPENRGLNLQLENEGNPQEILIQLPDSYPRWNDPHFPGHRNMILGIRINEGIVEGDMSTILQEVESTIHQRGASMRKEEVYRLMAKERISKEEARELVPLDWAYTIDDEGRMRLNDYPYKRTWHELGFKRALMEALRNPDMKRLVWPKGAVMVERAWEDWENNPLAIEGSKLLLDLHDKKLKRFSKRFLKKSPEDASSKGPGEVIDLWSIDLKELRERFKVKIRGEDQIHVPFAQKEKDGLLESYA